MKPKIVLAYPSYQKKYVTMPLSVLSLAGPLVEKGYYVEILDTRIGEPKEIDWRSVLFAGISAVSGYMIREGINVAKAARSSNPSMPIVWGGPHVTALPSQSLESEHVDVVVRGEGEFTILELAEKFESGKGLEKVRGISYKGKGGKVMHNPDRELLDLDMLGRPPYHLIDIKRNYPNAFHEFDYESSRGCPHYCEFCYGMQFHRQRWRSRSPKRVVDDLEFIASEYSPKRFSIIDDNFFVDTKRVENFCRELLKRKLRIGWSTGCRFDYSAKFSDSFLELLKRAGCYKLSFGAESGSRELLKRIKGITPEDILTSVRKFREHDIKVLACFMSGFPEETDEDLRRSMDLIDRMRAINPDVQINSVEIFTPFPGSPLFDRVKKLGYKPPSTFEAWGERQLDIDCSPETLPYIPKKRRRVMEMMKALVRYHYLNQRYSEMSPAQKEVWLGKGPRKHVLLAANALLSVSENFRWKHRFFYLPVEWYLWARAKDDLLQQS